jgi:hypothetical protein
MQQAVLLNNEEEGCSRQTQAIMIVNHTDCGILIFKGKLTLT